MTKSNSKKTTTANTPALNKKKNGAIAKSPKKSNSAFTKTVHLFKDQKDWFSADDYYKNW